MRRRRRGSSRTVPVVSFPFGWQRDYPMEFRNQRFVGGRVVRDRRLNIPVTARLLRQWLEAGENAPGEPMSLPGSTIADPLDGDPMFLSTDAVPEDHYKTWRAMAESPEPRSIVFRIFTSTNETIRTDPVALWILLWCELYWARSGHEKDLFQQLLDLQPQLAVSIFAEGFALVGQPLAERHRLRRADPSWLQGALEHPTKEIRERAITALSSSH